MDLPPMHPHAAPMGVMPPHHPNMYPAPPPPPPPPPQAMQQPMSGIEAPHSNDVLCGRGVTTNRHPGNEKFRALVNRNKELYVTSTKRQKMGISRTIVEAVRARDPPGRFLEKDQPSGLWFDIGDRKAIEKTSQALRDSAASLRKQLSEDLADPDFLKAVFDEKTAKQLSETDKSKKSAKPQKSHRRTKSDPMGKKPVKPAAKKQTPAGPSVSAKDAKTGPKKSSSSSQSSKKAHKRASTSKSHKRVHSAGSVSAKPHHSKECAPGSPYPCARRSSPASPLGFMQHRSPPASPYNHAWASPPVSPYQYNYGSAPPSPYHFNHQRAQSWDVTNGYHHQSPGQSSHVPQHGFKPVEIQKSSEGGDATKNGGQGGHTQSPGAFMQRPQSHGYAPGSPLPYMPYPHSPHQPQVPSPYYQHPYQPHGAYSPGYVNTGPLPGPQSDRRPASLVIPELGQDNEKQNTSSGWFPKPSSSDGESDARPPQSTNSNGGHAFAPSQHQQPHSPGHPHHLPRPSGSPPSEPHSQGHPHLPRSSGSPPSDPHQRHPHHLPRPSGSPPSLWPQPPAPPSPQQTQQTTVSPTSSQQQSNWPNPPPPPSRRRDSPPGSCSQQSQQSRPPPSPRTGASSPISSRQMHLSRPPPSPRQRSCSPGSGHRLSHPPRPPPSPNQRAASPGPGMQPEFPPRPPASPRMGATSPMDGLRKVHPTLQRQNGVGRTSSPVFSTYHKGRSNDKAMESYSIESRDENREDLCDKKPRKAFTFVDGKLRERTEVPHSGPEELPLTPHEDNVLKHVTPSPPGRGGVSEGRTSERCGPEVFDVAGTFDMSPVGDIHMEEDCEESHDVRGVKERTRGPSPDPVDEPADDIEVSPLPYRSNPLQEMSSSPLRELNENLLLLSPSSLSPPRGISMTPSSEDF